MTIITVVTPHARLDLEQRRALSLSLTDAVLGPELGRLSSAARAAFQVHFVERGPDAMAIGGALLCDAQHDVILVDISVMQSDWPPEVRTEVIGNVLAALAQACGREQPEPGWWVLFRIVEEGSWGANGRVVSIRDLLDLGIFSSARALSIERALWGGPDGQD